MEEKTDETMDALVIKHFSNNDDGLTEHIELIASEDNAKYSSSTFVLNGKRFVYRKAKITSDRPGAFLAIWQRPSSDTLDSKPVPLRDDQLDFLLVEVDDKESTEVRHRGVFVFPASVLVAEGIFYSNGSKQSKGKTGFRVFPPWSESRGLVGSKVFSASGKRTQRWQLPYFVNFDQQRVKEFSELSKLLGYND